MTIVHGTCSDRFTPVRQAFERNFEQGLEVGASVCVVHDGELVVDLWGGHADADCTTPWQHDTIANVWSTTKTMVALTALVLADRGQLDVDAPVAEYWPEFAVNGKERVLVRHLLAHTAGLPGWELPLSLDELYDWDTATSRLAAQAPWWEPGTASGYHAISQGHLVGEVVRRVTGRSLGQFFADEIAGPLGADFHIGTAPEHDHRVATVVAPPALSLADDADRNSVAFRAVSNPPLRAEVCNTEAWRRAEIPAANGHGNARSVARVQSVLAHRGELDGIRLLSEEACNLVFREQIDGTDLVLGLPVRLGIGYGLNSAHLPISPNPRACYWGGWGGSLVINDLDARLTVAYVMNRMGESRLGDFRGAGLVLAAMSALS
jgi:CubicO group peptidase (beta-lactamase class C family)